MCNKAEERRRGERERTVGPNKPVLHPTLSALLHSDVCPSVEGAHSTVSILTLHRGCTVEQYSSIATAHCTALHCAAPAFAAVSSRRGGEKRFKSSGQTKTQNKNKNKNKTEIHSTESQHPHSTSLHRFSSLPSLTLHNHWTTQTRNGAHRRVGRCTAPLSAAALPVCL